MGKKVGIDLGTTYSCVAYLNEDGGLEVLKNAEDSNTTPSLVFFENESNVIVGAPARAGSIYNPENLIERVKSYMGDPNYTINKFGVDYSPSAISSLILRKLKKDAEAALGDTIDGAVITCPAYFGTEARAATKKAGEDAGLNVLQIINEPTAAAYAYAYVKGTDINKTVLVYDLGGGTFDVTLLKMDFAGDKKDLTVLASNGDHTLGGKDWDARLTNLVINKFCDATGVDPDEMREDTDMIGWFSENTENNKQKLSHLETVKFGINFNGTKNLVEVSRDEFEAETEDLLAKTIDLVNATLADKNMTIDQVDEIILVGGSTYMPQVSKRLEAEYGKPLVSFEPNEAVVHSVLVNYLANQRQGTQSTKTRAEVSGGGRKPWRQKGTGRARQGSIRAPHWVGGGVALGPKPRSYNYTVNKKEKRLAIKSMLSSKVLENELVVVENLPLKEIKTKEMARILNNLKVEGKAVILLPEKDEIVQKSARNIEGVKTLQVGTINVYDLLKHKNLVVTEDTVKKLEEVYA